MAFYDMFEGILQKGESAVYKILNFFNELGLIKGGKAGSATRGFRFFKWHIIQHKDLESLDELVGNAAINLKSDVLHSRTKSPETNAPISETQNNLGEGLKEDTSAVPLQYGSPDGDEDEDDDEYQLVWGPILEIPNQSFVMLLSRLLDVSPADPSAGTLKVVERTEGSYNHVAILAYNNAKYVVKVPMVGTKDRWQEGHAEIMRSEAHTMMFIKNKLPNFPIPTVHFYDTTFDNEIGAPFHVLSFMEGKSAGEVWYNTVGDDEYDYANAGSPSEEREQARIKFLKSLARNMADLRNLEFSGIGMLSFENDDPEKPIVGPYHGWLPRNFEMTLRQYWERPVFNKSADSYTERLANKFGNDSSVRTTGMRMILEHLYQSPPFAASKKQDSDDHETFVLHHNDLNFQNILVNDYGEVTGIIDWDGVGTVPRCVGYSTVPIFLFEDWQQNYDVPESDRLPPWLLNKYRKVYADEMKKACGGPDTDAKYTEKSAMYGVINDLLFGDHPSTCMRSGDFIQKLLREIPLLRRVESVWDFMAALGRGWEEPNDILKEWAPKVLDCKNV